MKLEELKSAEYNPRRDLQPGDRDYEKLRKSIEGFGYVEPIVWNSRTGRVVGGHQRLKVLTDMGETAVDAVVVDLDETDEKILNLSLNKIKGRWDIEALADLLTELNEDGLMELTGFEEWELENMVMEYNHIQDLLDEPFRGDKEPAENDKFAVTIVLPSAFRKEAEDFLAETANAKELLKEALIRKIKEMVD